MRFRPFLLPAAALLVLALAVFWWQSRPRLQRSALELLPPETLFVLETDRGRDFLDKLRGTHLAALWREPEIQKMIGAQGGSWAAQTKKVVAPAVSQLRLGPAFVALLPGSAASPIWLASAEMGRDSAELNEDLDRLGSTFSPKVEMVEKPSRRHHRYDVFPCVWRSLSGEIAKGRNRFFFSTNPAALDALLDRWDRSNPAASLAKSPGILEAVGHLPTSWDSRLVLQPALITAEPWFGKIPSVVQAALAELPPLVVGENEIFERDFHDRFYLSQSPLAAWPAINTVHPFAAENIFEIRMPIEALAQFSQTDWPSSGSLKLLGQLRNSLFVPGISAAQWQEAFGPEIRFAVRWPGQAIRPAFLLSSRIRNAPAARTLAARLEKELRENFSSSGPLGPLYAPALTIDSDEIHLVSNPDDRSFFAPNAASAAKAFTALDRSSGSGGNAILALQFDSAQLADRGYRILRPLLLMSAQFLPRSPQSVQWNDLPRVETLSRHLGVTDLQIRPAGRGLLLESNGPVTVWQWLGLGLSGPAWLLQAPASWSGSR